MLSFCLHSCFREYGWQFFRHVFLPHPARTLKAFFDSGHIDSANSRVSTCSESPGPGFGGPGSVVGVGFCLKPQDPPCLSGRSNHDCHYLERLLDSGKPGVPECCQHCAIREIGLLSLSAGAAFYVMTSARDILFDLFMPALNERRFTSGVFALCCYSFRPFAVGLLASGVRARLFPFEEGDCRDYPTWLLADRGIKNERTTFSEPNRITIRRLLERAAKGPNLLKKFNRQDNILYPE